MLQFKLARWVLSGAAAGTILLSAGMITAAQARSGLPGKFSANVALTSEYLFRGLSQTDDAPAIQGGFDYEIEVAGRTDLYLGIWGSNVDFNEPGSVDGATIETDLYAGVKGDLARTGVSWDIGFIYYAYPGSDSGLDYDYWEIKGAVGYDFGIAKVAGSLNYSTDNFANSGEAVYTKFAVEMPIDAFKGLSLTGHVAQQTVERNGAFGTADYFEWNLGATYKIPRVFDVSVNYSDTDIAPDVEGKDEAVLVTISRRF
jgi:uncharacterized protein (TIGR02001 family)